MAEKGMSTTTKVLIWVGILATVGITGAIAIKIWQRNKDKKDLKAKTGEDIAPLSIVDTVFSNTPTTCRHCVKDASFPLQKGSQGKQVAAVQYAYNVRFPNKKITVDGDWGNGTEKAFALLGIDSMSFNGDSNFKRGWATYPDPVAGNTAGNTASGYSPSGSASGAGAGAGTLKIQKTIYDKYFKILETR